MDSLEDKRKIIKQLYNESGHRGREDIYRKTADKYWWDGIYENIKRFVNSCDIYQRRASNKQKKALYSIWIIFLWRKI